jgi:hypothetical protein
MPNEDIDPIFKPWMRETPLTDEEVERLRKRAMADYSKMGYGPGKFTCDDCVDKRICTLAFDLYNTDGDCLMMK